jgi:NADH:ubiquinone oxidoreductase subunit E
MQEARRKVGSALVVGGGIGGMQAALDLADAGIRVYLLDNKPSIGGVMSQLDKTFPTNDCAMCTMAPRLVAIGRHKDIQPITLADIERVEGEPGNFRVTIKKRARYVEEEKCTGCGTCVNNCPTRNRVQPLEQTRVEMEEEFKEKTIKIVQKHKGRTGPLMPILQEINSTFNYLPENVLRYVSVETGYPLSHILKIATFYSAFSIKPRGKYMINVCMGTTCYVRGGDKLLERFSDELKIGEGETTKDKLFTIRSVRCIGCCGLAPALMVNDEVFGKVTIPQVKEIIKKYREAA